LASRAGFLVGGGHTRFQRCDGHIPFCEHREASAQVLFHFLQGALARSQQLVQFDLALRERVLVLFLP
jgi:hypothetical protein